MFEQSILLDHAGPRKTGAFAASLTAQMAIAGVLLIIPLIYNQTLTILPPVALLQLPALQSAPPPVEHPATSSSTRPSVPRIFIDFRPAPAIRNPIAPSAATFENAPELGDSAAIGFAPSIPGLSPTDSLATLRVAPPPTTAVKDPITPQAPTTPTRISGTLLSAKLIKRILPLYPSAARLTRISGTVHLLGIIAKDGHIKELHVLDGHPLLRQAALEAVSQWLYSPTLLGGQPVEVEAPIDVIFSLNESHQ